jgi:hypothetical protein
MQGIHRAYAIHTRFEEHRCDTELADVLVGHGVCVCVCVCVCGVKERTTGATLRSSPSSQLLHPSCVRPQAG